MKSLIENIYRIHFIEEFGGEERNTQYFFKAKDRNDAYNKYMVKYGVYIFGELETEELDKDFKEDDQLYINVEEIMVENY